jgi:hypothetical protein
MYLPVETELTATTFSGEGFARPPHRALGVVARIRLLLLAELG